VGEFRPASVDIEKTPPVCDRCQKWSRVLVQSILVSVLDQPQEQSGPRYEQPMLGQQSEDMICNSMHFEKAIKKEMFKKD
jgi:hypothetical protein